MPVPGVPGRKKDEGGLACLFVCLFVCLARFTAGPGEDWRGNQQLFCATESFSKAFQDLHSDIGPKLIEAPRPGAHKPRFYLLNSGIFKS